VGGWVDGQTNRQTDIIEAAVLLLFVCCKTKQWAHAAIHLDVAEFIAV